ncbi:MAG: electron transfer flavoprotein subunit beta/FixA family protein [Armatimonadota bacterium]|nr:MAG: electron transfer flavoprotein subunit beta/FixA family protein [Armatimonadota bacterium]
MLNIVACIKQVPDTTQVRIDPETNTLVREGIPAIINPFDMQAIQAGVELKERYGGRCTMLCMGPPMAVEALQKGLSYGTDHGILLSDRALVGSDTLATSAALASAIRKLDKEERVDIVVCGKQTIDGDTAQVGPGIATRLGFSQITYVGKIESVDVEGRRLRARRILEGAEEVVEAPLPVLLTVLKEIGEPRYASLPAVIKGLRTPVPVWGIEEMAMNRDEVGLAGSPTQVRRIFAPPQRAGGEIIASDEGNPDRVAALLLDRLLADGVLEG